MLHIVCHPVGSIIKLQCALRIYLIYKNVINMNIINPFLLLFCPRIVFLFICFSMPISKLLLPSSCLSVFVPQVFVCLWKGCKVYNTPSTSQSWLQRHMLTHSGDKPFKVITLTQRECTSAAVSPDYQ